MSDTGAVVVGSRWAGFTGNVMEVRRLDGDRAYLSYLHDPGDGTWESLSDVADNLTLVRIGPVTDEPSC